MPAAHHGLLSAHRQLAKHEGQPVELKDTGDRDGMVTSPSDNCIILVLCGKPHVDLHVFATRDSYKQEADVFVNVPG